MDLRPWMIETAYDFVRASRVLWDQKLCAPSMVNAAIGLEILFKSFIAEVDGDPGGIGEQYRVPNSSGHNLLRLFDTIPDVIREELNFHSYRSYFEGRTGNLFVEARYPYEKNGQAGGGEAIIEIAEEMIEKVIQVYKDRDCTDPWIISYPELASQPTEKFLEISGDCRTQQQKTQAR